MTAALWAEDVLDGILNNRALVARASAIAMTGCRLTAGYFLGCALALQLAKNWLEQNAEFVATQYDASYVEAKNLLKGIKDSPNSFCSEAEIARFRELVFGSDYLKDAGRIRGGKIECSATEGRLTHPPWAIQKTIHPVGRLDRV